MRNYMLLALAVAVCLGGCTKTEPAKAPGGSTAKKAKPRLIVTLPDDCNTPDGCTLDAAGNTILSIPNFNNGKVLDDGTTITAFPAKMVMIDKNNKLSDWYKFKPEDLNDASGKVGPMDCAFGPDGHLYVADNQLFFDPDHKSRVLRINVENGKPVSCTSVAEGIICSNGMVWDKDTLYVSETQLIAPPADLPEGQAKPKLISGVYRFKLAEMNAGPVKLPVYDAANPDPHLIAVYTTSGSTGFGADGVCVDGAGNLYCGIFEDGNIYKTTFDAQGKPSAPVEFAKDPKMLCCDGIIFRPEDQKIYVADMLRNGVQMVDMKGNVETLHTNGDTDGADGSLDQPCEVMQRGKELIVISMDMPWPSDTLTNTKIDKPYTVSAIDLPKVK